MQRIDRSMIINHDGMGMDEIGEILDAITKQLTGLPGFDIDGDHSNITFEQVFGPVILKYGKAKVTSAMETIDLYHIVNDAIEAAEMME